jgi:hypothetical protein
MWREGGGYCGWAPLGVSATIGPDGEFSVGVVEPTAFVFVEEGHFLEPVRPATVVIDVTLVNRTATITRIGPKTEVIERATGRQIHAVSAKQLRHNQETATAARQPQLKALHHPQPPKRAQGQAAKEKEEERKPAEGVGAPKQKQEEKRQADKKDAAEKKKAKEEEEHRGKEKEQQPQQ